MKKIIKVFIFMLLAISLASCTESFDIETYKLKKEYSELMDRKAELESELRQLENSNELYAELIIDINNEIARIEKEVEESYSTFSKLENEILMGAVLITHYSYETDGWWIFSSDEVIAASQGSGFVIKETSSYYYIMTNNHVIEDLQGADKEKLYVYDYDLNQYEATLMFTSTHYDMAVLRISKISSVSLRVMKLAGSNEKSGSTVFAIGNPRGQINSIGIGKIKGYANITNSTYQVVWHNAFQLPGSSGGMLINEAYEVVGINTWGNKNNTYGSIEAFSSPVEKIKEFLKANSFSV